MSIVTLVFEKAAGCQFAWVDYSSCLLLTIRDYQGHMVELTEEQIAALQAFLAAHPAPVLDYLNDAEPEAEEER